MDIRMVTKEKSRGGVLIVVLVFCLLVGLIVKSSLETSALQFKIIHNYKTHQQNKNEADKALSKLERQLEKSTESLAENISLIQFVPDTLAFGERNGALYYNVHVKAEHEINSTFCVRKLNEQDEITALNFETLMHLKEKLNALRLIEAFELKIKSGAFAYVVAYQARDNHSWIAIIEKFGSKVIREFKLEEELSSSLLVIDSKMQGYADYIMMGNDAGEVLMLNLDSTITENWELITHNDLFKGKIIGKPIAGMHPDAKGILLYLLIQEPTKQHALIALELRPQSNKLFFKTKPFPQLGQPLLWQGFLLTHFDNQLLVFDAKSGEIQAEYALQNIATSSVPAQAFIQPQVLFEEPLDPNPRVVISDQYQTKQSVAPILLQRLGRKTYTYHSD